MSKPLYPMEEMHQDVGIRYICSMKNDNKKATIFQETYERTLSSRLPTKISASPARDEISR
jgi:hypothetical protein